MTDLLYLTSDVVPGRSGYAPGAALARAFDRKMCGRAWLLGPRLVSMQLSKAYGGGIWKSTDRLPMDPDHANDNLDRLEAAGVYHPASYGDCYHQLVGMRKPLPWTYNGLFFQWPGGPWSEALKVGDFPGRWYRYDLKSAYRWAATLNDGPPDPETYRVVTELAYDEPGLWVCEIDGDRSRLPNALRANGPVVLSSEEIFGYGIRPLVNVIRGVTWSRTLGAGHIESTLQRLPCAQLAGRAYWGRWIARDPLQVWTPARAWSMRNIAAHYVWGWLIVGRVRLRVWQAAKDAAHVYVDEILTPHELETGHELGAWHLKETYPRGVTVRRTGHYGAIDGPLTMMTGVHYGAEQRNAA